MPSVSARPFPSPASLLDAWRSTLEAGPDRPALIDAATGIIHSRHALQRAAEQWAQAQSPAGALQGTRGAFALPNGIDWMATFLGLLHSGATAVPLDASEPEASLKLLARHAGARLLVRPGSLDTLEGPSPDRPAPACLVKLTSGTTGVPRPLAFSDSEMAADGRQVCSSMGIRGDDLNLAIIPFGHSYGLGNLVMPLLLQGTPILCVSAPLPHAIAADCARWAPTVFPAVPALLRLLAASELDPAALCSLRLVISAGSAHPAQTAQVFAGKFGRRVHSFYGSSETGGITYDRTGDATSEGRSVGPPLDGVTLRFDDEQRFWVESAAVVTQGNPQRSADGRFGAFQPSDQGALNSQGELTLIGRAGRMMKIAGRRVDLAELEHVLRQLPGIADAYVTPHPDRPEELAAILATSLTAEDARACLRSQLAPWKMPRRLMTVREFPLTHRGKPDTKTLQAWLSAGRPA